MPARRKTIDILIETVASHLGNKEQVFHLRWIALSTFSAVIAWSILRYVTRLKAIVSVADD